MRILVVDDHALVRKGICSVLATSSTLTVCGEAVDGQEGVDKARELRPDIVVMDLSMPRLNGLEATREIKRLLPDTEILIVTQHESPEMARQAFGAGARGYVSKSAISTDLLAAIAKIGRNESIVHGLSLNGPSHRLDLQGIKGEQATGLLAAIVESSDDAIVSKDLDGTITSWNQGAERIFGYKAEEAIGRNIRLIIPADHQDEEGTILARVKRGERIEHFETVRMRRDGTYVDISLTVSPVRDSSGRVIGASKVARDIGERIRVEGELRRNEEQLRALASGLESQVHIRTQELEQRNAEILEQSEQLRELSNRLLQTQDYERRHIARELHDSAGQTLTVLGMNLAKLVQNARNDAPQLAKDAEEILQLVQQLSQEIRTTSYLLHPPLLDESGLEAALSWYIKGLQQRSGIEITLNISEQFGRLPRDLELTIFRVVQECLTNVHRHSGSGTADITIARKAQTVSVVVQDQGKGLSREELKEIQARGSGVGMRGMRERVRLFQGTMNIESNGSGIRVSATIPVSESASTSGDHSTRPLRAAV
jgi:PAS domain S-box-containing protein